MTEVSIACCSAASWLRAASAACCARILLAARLLGPEPLDLAANRREELLALGEPRLDLALGLGPRGDHRLLVRLRRLQPVAPNRHLAPEPLHLLEHLRVLLGHAVDRVEAVDEVFEARAAEEDLER